MFDYDNVIEEMEKKIDQYNLNGRNETITMLRYLKVCPFIDVVAGHMGITRKDVYGKLRYYLGFFDYESLIEDLLIRKENIKKEFLQALKIVDQNA